MRVSVHLGRSGAGPGQVCARSLPGTLAWALFTFPSWGWEEEVGLIGLLGRWTLAYAPASVT